MGGPGWHGASPSENSEACVEHGHHVRGSGSHGGCDLEERGGNAINHPCEGHDGNDRSRGGLGVGHEELHKQSKVKSILPLLSPMMEAFVPPVLLR